VYKFAFASNWIPRICLKSTYEVAIEFHPFLISLLPVECGTQGMLHTHIRGGSFGMRCMYMMCAVSSPTDWRQQTGRGEGDRWSERRWTWPQSARLLVALGQETWREGGVEYSPLFISFDDSCGYQWCWIVPMKWMDLCDTTVPPFGIPKAAISYFGYDVAVLSAVLISCVQNP
jgi:hypothetical protein